MIFDLSNKMLYAELSKYVKGHDEAKKALIVMLNRSRIRYKQRWGSLMHSDFLLPTCKVLLMGASGTGKTHLVESLSRISSFPLIRVDATKFNPTGGSGGIKEENLRKMIVDNAAKCHEENPKCYFSVDGAIDQTVVFVDEIDKLGHSFDSSGKWNDHVQSNFLTLFDHKNEFAGVSFVFAGAFSSLFQKQFKDNSIGFISNKVEHKMENIEDLLVKAGLLPELVGRMTSIVQLDRFTKDDYYDILITRLLPKKQVDMAAMGILNIELDDHQIDEMVGKAFKSEQGVRSLQRELDRLFLDLEFNFESNSQYKRLN